MQSCRPPLPSLPPRTRLTHHTMRHSYSMHTRTKMDPHPCTGTMQSCRPRLTHYTGTMQNPIATTTDHNLEQGPCRVADSPLGPSTGLTHHSITGTMRTSPLAPLYCTVTGTTLVLGPCRTLNALKLMQGTFLYSQWKEYIYLTSRAFQISVQYLEFHFGFD